MTVNDVTPVGSNLKVLPSQDPVTPEIVNRGTAGKLVANDPPGPVSVSEFGDEPPNVVIVYAAPVGKLATKVLASLRSPRY